MNMVQMTGMCSHSHRLNKAEDKFSPSFLYSRVWMSIEGFVGSTWPEMAGKMPTAK
jgi:hypothetical protein